MSFIVALAVGINELTPTPQNSRFPTNKPKI